MISNISVSICNLFHSRRANSGKITILGKGTSLWHPRFRETSSPRGTKFCRDKQEYSGQPMQSEDFVIIACTVLIQ